MPDRPMYNYKIPIIHHILKHTKSIHHIVIKTHRQLVTEKSVWRVDRIPIETLFNVTLSWYSRRRERRTLRVRWVYIGWLRAGWRRGHAVLALARRCTRSAWCPAASASCRQCAGHRPGALGTSRTLEVSRSADVRRRWTRRRGLHGSRSVGRRCSRGYWRPAAASDTPPRCRYHRTIRRATASSWRRRPDGAGRVKGHGDGRSGTGWESAV